MRTNPRRQAEAKLENLEILEIPENLQTVEIKGKSDCFLEILGNLETLEISPVKRPLS